jgi:hypothetical protein
VIVYGRKFGCHACRISGSSASGPALPSARCIILFLATCEVLRSSNRRWPFCLPYQFLRLLNDFCFFSIHTTAYLSSLSCGWHSLPVSRISTLQYGQFCTLCK